MEAPARCAIGNWRLPGTILRRVNTSIGGWARAEAYTDDEEATAAAVTVVAAGHIAEHGGGVGRVLDAGRRQVCPVIRDRIPHGEAPAARLREENATVPAVEGPRDAAAVVVRCICMGERGDRHGGDEAREGRRVIEAKARVGAWEIEVVEEAEQGRRASVEGVVVAKEAGVGEDAVPALAGEGSLEEARGLVWSDVEEDLRREVVVQLRRRARRCHAHRARGRVWVGDDLVVYRQSWAQNQIS